MVTKVDQRIERITYVITIQETLREYGPLTWRELEKMIGLRSSELQRKLKFLIDMGAVYKKNGKYFAEWKENLLIQKMMPQMLYHSNKDNLEKIKPEDLYCLTNAKSNEKQIRVSAIPVSIYGLPKSKLKESEIKEINQQIKIINKAKIKINKIANQHKVNNIFICG